MKKPVIDPYTLRRIRRGKIKEISCLVLAAVVLAVFITFIYLYVNRANSLEITDQLYQYYTGIRYEYDGVKKLSVDEDGKVYLELGDRIEYPDDVPLYYTSKEAVIVPNNMVYIAPNATTVFQQMQFLTELFYDESNRVVRYQVNDEQDMLSNGFLFNGTDLYVFLEPVTLLWNGKAYPLERFSYAEVIYNDSMRVFSYADESFYMNKIGAEQVEVNCIHGYHIDLQTDTLRWDDGREVILFTEPSILPRLGADK